MYYKLGIKKIYIHLYLLYSVFVVFIYEFDNKYMFVSLGFFYIGIVSKPTSYIFDIFLRYRIFFMLSKLLVHTEEHPMFNIINVL